MHAKWVVPVSREPIEDGAVVVEGERIAAVGDYAQLVADYPDAEIREFGSAVIMPGFVDLHTHLEYSVFRGVCDDLDFGRWKVQLTRKTKQLTLDDWQVSARLGALEALRSGITTVADITPTGASLDAAIEAGMRARIYMEVTGMDPRETTATVEASLSRLDDWQHRAGGSLVELGFAPSAPYTVAPTLYRDICAKARQMSLPVATHLAASQDEYDFVKYGSGILAGSFRDIEGWSDLLWQPTGVTPVKYLEQWDVFESDILVVHCVHVNRDDLGLLRKYGVSIAHCPRCNAKLGMGIAPLEEFRARDICVGLGTDSPASNNTMDFFDEMRIGLLLQRGSTSSAEGIQSADFVKMATMGGARALGMEDRIGCLEPGYQADVIVVDLAGSHQLPALEPYSALVYTANQEDVGMTMVAGRILFENGRYSTLDEQDISNRSMPIRERLAK